jgi:hypothetical protein
MSEATGNVWNDPRTGKPANPQNVIADEFYGRPTTSRYGPEVGGGATAAPAEPTAPASPFRKDKTIKPPRRMPLKKAGEAVAGVDRLEELPEAKREFGPGVGAPEAPAKAASDGSAEMVAEMRRLYQAYTRGKGNESQRAYKELQRLADEEYARPEGSRKKVAEYLRKQGFSRSAP